MTSLISTYSMKSEEGIDDVDKEIVDIISKRIELVKKLVNLKKNRI